MTGIVDTKLNPAKATPTISAIVNDHEMVRFTSAVKSSFVDFMNALEGAHYPRWNVRVRHSSEQEFHVIRSASHKRKMGSGGSLSCQRMTFRIDSSDDYA